MPSDDRPPVRLRRVYAWTCTGCGATNIVEETVLDPERPKDADRIREALDLDEWQPIPADEKVVYVPSRVRCKACRFAWRALFPGQDE